MGVNFDVNAFLEKIGLSTKAQKWLFWSFIIMLFIGIGLWIWSSAKKLTRSDVTTIIKHDTVNIYKDTPLSDKPKGENPQQHYKIPTQSGNGNFQANQIGGSNNTQNNQITTNILDSNSRHLRQNELLIVLMSLDRAKIESHIFSDTIILQRTPEGNTTAYFDIKKLLKENGYVVDEGFFNSSIPIQGINLMKSSQVNPNRKKLNILEILVGNTSESVYPKGGRY